MLAVFSELLAKMVSLIIDVAKDVWRSTVRRGRRQPQG